MKNREIKFHCWDIKNKAIRNVWGLNWSFDGKDLKSIIAVDPVINGEYILKEGEFELMQYTGFKDSKGVEIYEGYIVKVGDTIRQVVFKDAKFQITGVEPQYNAFYDLVAFSEDEEAFEVIGNIWETPELLELSQEDIPVEEEIQKEKLSENAG